MTVAQKLMRFQRFGRELSHLDQYMINEAEVNDSERYRTFLFIQVIDRIINKSERRFTGTGLGRRTQVASPPSKNERFSDHRLMAL
jgi:hypothetical protein